MIAILGAGAASAARAQDDPAKLLETRTVEVIAVLQGKRDPAEVFDARFLAAVPTEQLRALTAKLTAQGGELLGYTGFQRERQGSATFTLRFAHATAPARIELNPAAPGKVSGFRIFGLTPGGDSFGRIDADFANLRGKAGYAVFRFGEDGGSAKLTHGRAADTRLAIGSTFKLYVLAALTRQVQEGKRRWSDVVPVTGKSFPGGTIHNLPEGAPVTLHTLASLMISISDNSATDILVRLIGPEALEREVRLSGHAKPDATLPILTTAQIFALKRQGKDAADRYARAAPAQRAAQLAVLDVSGVSGADPGEVFGHGPVAIEQVEWFASPADLTQIMDDLLRLDSKEAFDILAINPAMDEVTAKDWSYVGYKGGSEDGVISMTWLLRDKTGAWSAVSGSWNDPKAAVDNDHFQMLMLRLAKLAGG
ncbi:MULTISPECIES: serine hydrolase [unclassified Novosphingobium]|uniref:serine hydrolase n=1 Tax=unclassified Novosphingobium TaxID=2644732 RepID=UPI00135B98A6|nr:MULTISPECIES: serine hydrolase [unclassified Novosphingobium]